MRMTASRSASPWGRGRRPMSGPRPRPWFIACRGDAEQSVRLQLGRELLSRIFAGPADPVSRIALRRHHEGHTCWRRRCCRVGLLPPARPSGPGISPSVAARSSSTPPKARRWRSTVSKADGGAFQGKRPGVSGAFAAQGTLVLAGRICRSPGSPGSAGPSALTMPRRR
jgi:hypothetical protein